LPVPVPGKDRRPGRVVRHRRLSQAARRAQRRRRPLAHRRQTVRRGDCRGWIVMKALEKEPGPDALGQGHPAKHLGTVPCNLVTSEPRTERVFERSKRCPPGGYRLLRSKTRSVRGSANVLPNRDRVLSGRVAPGLGAGGRWKAESLPRTA